MTQHNVEISSRIVGWHTQPSTGQQHKAPQNTGWGLYKLPRLIKSTLSFNCT